MRGLVHRLRRLYVRAGAALLWGGLVLGCAHLVQRTIRPAAPKVTVAPAAKLPVTPAPKDFALIDEVLARRAPDLGLTLREQLGKAIAEEAAAAKFDPLLVLAVIDVESDFAIDAVSEKGARGLMQIKPATLHFLAETEGLRLTREEVDKDPSVKVRLGIRYLRRLVDQFGGDLDLALMAYNAGPANVRRAMREDELEVLRRYPASVRRTFRRFREGAGLGGDWALAVRAGKGEISGDDGRSEGSP